MSKLRGSYQTKQRGQILEYLVRHPYESLSAKEIYAALREAGSSLGLSTIYRQLEQSAREGTVKKIVAGDGAGARFQIVTEKSKPDMFYLKCNVCGSLTQMDCHLLFDVTEHLHEEHGFHVDAAKSILYGRCQSCKP